MKPMKLWHPCLAEGRWAGLGWTCPSPACFIIGTAIWAQIPYTGLKGRIRIGHLQNIYSLLCYACWSGQALNLAEVRPGPLNYQDRKYVHVRPMSLKTQPGLRLGLGWAPLTRSWLKTVVSWESKCLTFNQTIGASLQMVHIGSALSDSNHFYGGVYCGGRNRSQMIYPSCTTLPSSTVGHLL